MEFKVAKKEIISHLEDIRVVIGNGFDLYCGLKSHYEDYFYSCKKYHELFKTIRDFRQASTDLNIDHQLFNLRLDIASIDSNLFKESTIWDFFFYLNSTDYQDENRLLYDKKWCDIENMMRTSFIDDNKSILKSKIKWSNVLKILQHSLLYAQFDFREHALAYYIKLQGNLIDNYSAENFYAYLMNELKRFEKNFGKFIQKQSSNKIYKQNYINLLKKLTNNHISRISSIDSFNYSRISDETLKCSIENIHGDFNNPIFGIDNDNINQESLVYEFTKINRKLELYMSQNKAIENNDFKDIVVFGHSLNPNDYSYFYPLLNNVDKNHKIVFAYYVYNESDRLSIEKNLRLNVIKLINNYEREIKGRTYNRLLDSLHFNKCILFYEIDNVGINKIKKD